MIESSCLGQFRSTLDEKVQSPTNAKANPYFNLVLVLAWHFDLTVTTYLTYIVSRMTGNSLAQNRSDRGMGVLWRDSAYFLVKIWLPSSETGSYTGSIPSQISEACPKLNSCIWTKYGSKYLP